MSLSCSMEHKVELELKLDCQDTLARFGSTIQEILMSFDVSSLLHISISLKMPGLLVAGDGTKKRKRTPHEPEKRRVAKRRDTEQEGQESRDRILALESQILESNKYTNIEKLLEVCSGSDGQHNEIVMAAVVLCRVFCRLLAGDKMAKSKNLDQKESEQVDWLKKQCKLYVKRMCALLDDEDTTLQSTALTLLMRLVKEETSQEGSRAEQAWRTGTFAAVVRALVVSANAGPAREEFVEKFVEEHDDVRFFTFYVVADILRKQQGLEVSSVDVLDGTISLMSQVEGIPDADEQLEDWYGQAPEQTKHQLRSINAHKKQAQEAWLSLFRHPLSKTHRKTVLALFTKQIAPWFSRPETLMDFLTDSYDEGGATSLLALSGLFYLIQERNLDYPQFYPKLYSLLDEGILHSKHRSRFFRLLDTFLSSTHLPAAMVASFIKRLSRLALFAPPGGIVVVVPWIYNMLKKHPTCTFMIHRETRDSAARQMLEEKGMDDPFDMDESDPMETQAIESCLWEIETLQTHYHPNVATLAKIISEQFTKREYSLEDFLDHTYQGLIDAELGKEIKKAPVVEFEIPKRIFTNDEGSVDRIGGLLQQALEVS